MTKDEFVKTMACKSTGRLARAFSLAKQAEQAKKLTDAALGALLIESQVDFEKDFSSAYDAIVNHVANQVKATFNNQRKP